MVPRRVMPSKSLSEHIQIARGSIVMANKRGDKGQPCLVSLWRGKGGDSVSFVCTEALGEEYKGWTQRIKMLSKPNLSITSKGNLHFTRIECLLRVERYYHLRSPGARQVNNVQQSPSVVVGLYTWHKACMV